MLLATFIYGLVNAATLALYALGFNLTFGVSGLANFAYGSLYVLSGYAAWGALNKLGLPPVLALALAPFLAGATAFALNRLLLVRLRGQKEAEVIATFGAGLVILETLRYLGFIGLQFSLAPWIRGGVRFWGVFLDWQRIIILISGVLLSGGLWWFTRHTRLGQRLRAISQDEDTALSLGIDPDRAADWAMGLGGGLVGTAAVVILPIGNISADAGYEVLLQALAVCIVGGLGSTAGVLAAAAVMGLAQTFAALYLGSHYMMIVTLGAVLAILLAKPSGLFARHKELEERA